MAWDKERMTSTVGWDKERMTSTMEWDKERDDIYNGVGQRAG